jgi:hypothetical protein
MTIPLDFRRSAKPCPFKAFRSLLTPAVSTLARPSLNLFPCYILPATGGRVPLVYPERARRVNQPRLLTVDCRLLTFRESLTTSSISFISPPYEHQPRISLVSPRYAKTEGWVPPQKCRRADIFDFSPDFSHFSRFEPGAKRPSQPARFGPFGYAQGEGRPLQNRRRRPEAAPTKKAGHGAWVTRLSSPVTSHQSLAAGHRPLDSLSPLSSPCRFQHGSTWLLLRGTVAKRKLGESRQGPGARAAGMSPFEHRCPDAHD